MAFAYIEILKDGCGRCRWCVGKPLDGYYTTLVITTTYKTRRCHVNVSGRAMSNKALEVPARQACICHGRKGSAWSSRLVDDYQIQHW